MLRKVSFLSWVMPNTRGPIWFSTNSTWANTFARRVGVLTCLWHALTPGEHTVPARDQIRIQRYLRATGDPEKMRQLLAER